MSASTEKYCPFDRWYEKNRQRILDQSPSLLQEDATLRVGKDSLVIRFDDLPQYLSYLSEDIYGLVIHPIAIDTREVRDGYSENTTEEIALFRIDTLRKAKNDKNRIVAKFPKYLKVFAECNSVIFLKDLNNNAFKKPLDLETIVIFKVIDIDHKEDTVTIGHDDLDWG